MKNKIAIVIPIYDNKFSNYEEFTFLHNLKVFKNREIFLLGPKRVENYLHFLQKKLKNVKVRVINNKFFGSTSANSRLMTSTVYYNAFKNYDYTLMCHNDAIVFKDDLDYWMGLNYDMIGAPTFQFDEPSINSLKKSINGGLSLRKTKACLRVLEETSSFESRVKIYWEKKKWSLKHIYNNLFDGFIFNYYFPYYKDILHEDTFWSSLVPALFPWFKIANFNHTRYFAFEVNPRLLYELNNEVLPMGVHAWWKYDESFCTKLIEISMNGKPLAVKKSKISILNHY